ncbi:MAG: protease complex subunit PrcB family protein [Planctomycetota bacterium]
MPRGFVAIPIALALMSIALAGCEPTRSAGPALRSDLQLLAVNSGQIGPPRDSAIARVYKSARQVPRNAGQWLLSADAVDFSRVDWRRRDVVTVSLGRKPTSGYEVRIDRIVATDWGLDVYVTEFSPRPGQPVAQVVTHPWAAALVYKSDNTVINNLYITRAASAG